MTHVTDAASVSKARTILHTASLATLAALAVDGFLCAVMAVLFLPLYLGSTPFPVSALAAGAANVVLVRAAKSLSINMIQTSLPLVGFFVGLLLCTAGGPGGDVLLIADWRALLLLVAGMAPPAALLFAARLKAIAAAGA